MFKLIRNKRGVTLVELLIAAVILSIGLITLIYSLNRFSKATVFCQNIKHAKNLCQDLMEEIRVKKFDEFDEKASWPLGVEGEELPRVNFDDIDDYHGLVDYPITDIGGKKVEGFTPFTRTVEVYYVDGNFEKTAEGSTTPFKLIKVKVKWRQDIGVKEEKVVSLSCIKAKDTVSASSGWDYVFLSNDNLSVVNASITGNIHSNKNASLKGCKVLGNITTRGKIEPETIPGSGSRQTNACAVSMPSVTYPKVLLPEEPNLDLCELKDPQLSCLPFEINLQYYKDLALSSGVFYNGNINYKTNEKCKVLIQGGVIDTVIYATGNITIGSDWWKDPETKITLTENGALIAEGNIYRWTNGYSITAPYPRKINASTGKYQVALLALKEIILDRSTTLKGTFFALEDIDFSPFDKGSISLEGDVRTLKNIRTDRGGKCYGGESITIINSLLFAGNACLLHRIGKLDNVEVRSSGKIMTQASYRDSLVEAGIFLCSGGGVKGNFYAKENIVFVSEGKNSFLVSGVVRTNKHILSHNDHLGLGFSTQGELTKLHAREAIWIENLSSILEGDIKSLGKRQSQYSWHDGAVEAGFLACGGGSVSALINCQERVYLIPGGKSKISIMRDIATNDSLITYNTHLGDGVIINAKLNTGETCLIKNLSGQLQGEIRAKGKILTSASWRDSEVTASVLICGGGEVKSNIHAQDNVYLIPAGKSNILVGGNILSKKSILSYNSHLGMGINFSGSVYSNYYAGNVFKINNLSGNFKGILKAGEGVEMIGNGVSKIEGGVFSPKDCTISDNWGSPGESMDGCVVANKITINNISKISYNKDYAQELLK